MGVTDANGLVKANELLTVYYPNTNKAMVFRVISRQNEGFERFTYGTIPTSVGDVLNTYDAGTATVGIAGELPARSYTTGKQFPASDVWDTTDQWFVPYTWNDRVYHAKMKVTPGFVRVGLQIPQGVNQSRFQKERVVGGASYQTGFGYHRGELEIVFMPEMHYGIQFGNDTNLNLRTGVEFVYGEYIVKIPNSASLIFDVLSRSYPCHWVGLPVTTADSTITQGLKKTWGFDGFQVYPNLKRDQAIKEYTAILGSPDVVSKGVLM
jgi:hypothetical protein